jgi:hypothetical protein
MRETETERHGGTKREKVIEEESERDRKRRRDRERGREGE